jgi:DNA-binding MarR family transcriptional regulator
MKYYIERFLKNIQNLPEQKKMLVSIDYTSDMVRKHFELILGKYGITPSQYNLLAILRGAEPEPCQIKQLKEMIIDRNCDVSRMVERLCNIGLVVRRRNPDNLRSAEVRITAAGLALLGDIAQRESEALYTPFFHISDTEARQLNELLQKVLDGLKQVKLH